MTLWFCLLTFLFGNVCAFAKDSAPRLQPFTVVLHVHSDTSGEPTTLVELKDLAGRRRVDAIILTDYFQQKVSWGLYPWHRFLKVWFEKDCILKKGTASYYRAIDEANAQIPKVPLFPGAEVTPFYWWSGSIWKKDWTVHSLQKNLLVFGLDAKALEGLPTLESGKLHSDPYHGAQRDFAYQAVIDYVNQNKGFVVWSTPDESFGAESSFGPVHLSTPAYTEALLQSRDYTGIGIYPEGYRKTGAPGGVWDHLLRAYCRGKLWRPPWGFAEGVIHQKNSQKSFDRWDNIVFAEENTEKAVFDALRKGRFYIRIRKQGEIFLEDFSAADSSARQNRALLGETLQTGGNPELSGRIVISKEVLPRTITLEIFRSGESVWTETSESGVLDFKWQDPQEIAGGEKIYYRLQATTRPTDTGTLLTNPVFILKKK